MAAATAKEQELKIAAKISEIETLRNEWENSKLLARKSQKITDLKIQNLKISNELDEHKLTINKLKFQEMLQKKRAENFYLQNQKHLEEIGRISALLQERTEAKTNLEHEFQMVKNDLQTLEQNLEVTSSEKAKFQDQLKFQSQLTSQQKTIKQQAVEIAKLNDKLKTKLGELEVGKNNSNSMESHQSLKQKIHSQEKTILNQCEEINSFQNAIKTLQKEIHQLSAENENQLPLRKVQKYEESINRQNNSIWKLEELVKAKSSELEKMTLKMHQEIDRFQAIDLENNEELTKLRKDLAKAEQRVSKQDIALILNKTRAEQQNILSTLRTKQVQVVQEDKFIQMLDSVIHMIEED